MGLGHRGSGTPTGPWRLSLSMYRVIPAETQMQGKGTLAHVCQVLVELRVRIKSGKIKTAQRRKAPRDCKDGGGVPWARRLYGVFSTSWPEPGTYGGDFPAFPGKAEVLGAA